MNGLVFKSKKDQRTAMKHFFLIIVLSFQSVFSNSASILDSEAKPEQHKNGSHSLLKRNELSGRKTRCVPCGDDNFDRPGKMPISNQLNPEYRGNGADNLGYDWSPMAWGGLAFPHRSKMIMIGMQGRDGRQMGKNLSQPPGNPVHIICDTCRAYWDGSMDFKTSNGNPMGGQGFYGSGGRSDYRPRGRMMRPQEFETRITSPTVGVLVKPGSRIAYIPSKSGDMYWDGISGGGTRWDGFSNGISWVMHGSSDWDRMDPSKYGKPGDYGPASQGSEKNYPHHPHSDRPWHGEKGVSGYDSSGKGYYFANGYPNQPDPQWRDRNYASNWHYGSTNQNGWNGNNMKWNYGAKNWDDSDRSANRFYFNSPEDKEFGRDGNFLQYGDKYPTYQRDGNYPAGMRFFPYWLPTQGFRTNDRDPASFSNEGDRNRPWDYNSVNRFENQRPGFRPDGRPGPSFEDTGKYPLANRYDKVPGPDKIDKPGVLSFGYGPIPSSETGFPYGGTHFPDRDGTRRPSGEHLFHPHSGYQQPTFGGSFGGVRPVYQGGGVGPGPYPASENQFINYLNGGKSPPFMYGNGRPFGGEPGGYFRPEIGGGRPYNEYQGFPDGYPKGGGRPNLYPIDEGSDRYPSGFRPSGTYGGVRPGDGYPSGGSRPGGSYPSGGSRPEGGYPSGGSRPDGGYPIGGSRPDGGYPSGGSRPGGGYPSGGNRPEGGYPSGGGRPDGGYPSGGSRPGSGYPSGGSRPEGGYPNDGNRPGSGYPSGESKPDSGYPSGGTRPEGGYPSGGSRPDGGYPSGGSRPHPTGGTAPGSYPNMGGPSYPLLPGAYSSGGFTYPRGYAGEKPTLYPNGNYPDGSRKPDGYSETSNRPFYAPGDHTNYPEGNLGGYSSGGKNFPKGYYTGFITELNPNRGHPMFGSQDGYSSNYPGDKNTYSGINKDRYPFGGEQFNRYPSDFKGGYPFSGDNRFPFNNNYGLGSKDKYPGGDRLYFYGHDTDRDKYAGGQHSGGSSDSDYNKNPSFGHDKNSWNYGENDRKDGIYRRSGGSYPPYKGGQYFTSSYLASMSTPSGSTQEGSETKAQTVTKPDEVTPSTSQSS